ncbi:RBBP9/YdeN family alpha/beta hydrolase [Kitasatospora sp. NPDC051853]|uniref:RBBP9/YdeN family alpha/beta hydrolase n=1 Tax=Kitasatospora sp. NPDC051853 TaxID=3364058 RepID=UPI0037A4A7D4
MGEIIVSHAFSAGPEVLWYPSLKAELEAEGHRVEIPGLPEPHAPSVDGWVKTVEQAAAEVDPGRTVLVGHSLGSVGLLRALERHDTGGRGAFAGVVLVASMSREVGYEALAPFFAGGFDWARIRAAAGPVRVLVAADDPVLAPDVYAHVREFTEQLGATAVVLPEGGHLPNWTPDAVPVVRVPQVAALVRELLPA